MPNRRSAEPRRGRLSSPTTWVALLAGGAVAGAIALAMTPASAEASSTTATLTFTGIVDSNCQVSTGGTTAHVAPGGTVTVKASLAGASVKVKLPASLPGLPPNSITIPLDSAKVASFVDKVKIDGKSHTLKTASAKIVLHNVNGTHTISWKTTAVSLLGGLGTVPLNGNDVNLPAGGQLSWSGKIVASKNTNCGVQIAVPTAKVSAPGHTVTISGTHISLPNPLPSLTKKLTPPNLPIGGSSSSKPAHHPKTKSGGGGPTIKYTPPPTTVPEKVMPHAVNFGGGGSGNGGFAPPAAGGGGGGVAAPVAAPPVTSTAPAPPTTSPAAKKIKPGKTVDVAQRDQLGGAQLPVLLAILAILALSTVTAMYARMYLLRRGN
jgi:hypothetical protein